MLRVGIGVLIILLFCGQAYAERYWVVGSYSYRKNAFAEQERLSAVLPAEVLVVPNQVANTFRVIVKQSAVTFEELKAANVEIWSTDILVTDEHDEGSVALALPPFKPGESFESYCARVDPPPEFCEADKLAALIKRQKMLEEYIEQLSAMCESTTNEKEQEICKDWREKVR